MNAEQKNDVMAIVDSEGFDYAFCSYSDFEEIDDVEFHKLRKEYQDISERLKTYIGYDEY